MSVFTVDSKFRVVLNKDAVKLVPELAGLSQKELIYVILTTDYKDSPLREQPFEERRNNAMKMIYGKTAKTYPEEKSEIVKKAMEAYHGLIFDLRRVTVDIYKRKVQSLHMEILRDLPIRELQEKSKTIEFYENKITKIESELDKEEKLEDLKLKGKRKLSEIEKWQMNQMKHREFMEGQNDI